MKISLNWLKNYVAFSVPTPQLAHLLTMAGQEVKKIETVDGDQVFEIEVTPNRSDCLNHLGIARELSAILGKPLKMPQAKTLKSASRKINISISDKEACRRYVGALIQNVFVKDSSSEIASKLRSVDLRCINNVVDITNFGLMENGQPLHAFDFDKLVGGQIIVRRAQAHEKIVTIDGVERTLDPSILVIADAQKPVAIAGVMGGKATEVTHATRTVLLESAWFDPILVRRAARKLGLASDSSYRFERGVDLQQVAYGCQRAIALIEKFSGATCVAFHDVVAKKIKSPVRLVTIDLKEVERKLGFAVPLPKVKMMLARLGFGVRAGKSGVLKLSVPSFRPDVKAEVDIVEEIARVIGYDQLPTSFPVIKPTQVRSDTRDVKKRLMANALNANGVFEAITFSLVGKKDLDKCGLSDKHCVRLVNPLSRDQDILRPSLLPSLLTSAQVNLNRGEKNVRLFEFGKIYSHQGEQEVLGILLVGRRQSDWRLPKKELVNFFDLKGIVSATVSAAVEPKVFFDVQASVASYFDDQEKAGLSLAERSPITGSLGKLSGRVLAQWDIKSTMVYYAEIMLEPILSLTSSMRRFHSLPEFPSVVRDVSLAVPQHVAFATIAAAVLKEKVLILKEIRFIEEYSGEKIPAGQRGLVFSLIYQAPDRTLKEEEVFSAQELICQMLARDFSAIQR